MIHVREVIQKNVHIRLGNRRVVPLTGGNNGIHDRHGNKSTVPFFGGNSGSRPTSEPDLDSRQSREPKKYSPAGCESGEPSPKVVSLYGNYYVEKVNG